MAKVKSKRGGHPRGTERAKKQSILLRWWTSVISRKRSWDQSIRSILGGLCFRLLRCINRTGFVCVSNDGRNSDGCHCKTSRLCRTSSRLRISIHSSKNGRHSDIVDTSGQNRGQTLKIQWFLSNEIYMDTHWRDTLGRDSLRKFFWNLDGKMCRIGNVSLFIEHKDYSCRYTWTTYKNAWKKLMLLYDLGEPTSIFGHVYLGCAQRECKSNENIIEEYKTRFGSRISAGVTEKIPGVGGTSRKDCRIRHARLREKMRGKILRTGQQKDWAIVQSLNSMLGRPFLQERKAGDGWRIHHSVLANWLEMFSIWPELVDLTFFDPWTKLHELSQNGLEPVTNVQLVWFPIFITRVITDNIAMRGNTARHCQMFVPRLWLCWALKTLNRPRWISCIFGSRTFGPRSWMCKKQTSVSHSSIESEVLSLDAGLRLDGIPAHDLWDLVVEECCILLKTFRHREIDRAMKPKALTNPNTNTKIHSNREVDELPKVDHVVTSAKPSHFEAQLYNFEDKWSCDQNDHQGLKSDGETRVLNLLSRAGWVVWQSQFGPQNPNQICWHQKPTRRHVDERQCHPWCMESSSPIVEPHESCDVFLQPLQTKSKIPKPRRKRLMQERKPGEELVVANLKPTMSVVLRSVSRSPTLDSGVSYSLGNCGMQGQNSDRSGIEKSTAQKMKDENENTASCSRVWHKNENARTRIEESTAKADQRSGIEKSTAKIQNRLTVTRLTHHKFEILDVPYFEKVSASVRQKLKRLEEDQILDLKVNGITWGYLCQRQWRQQFISDRITRKTCSFEQPKTLFDTTQK